MNLPSLFFLLLAVMCLTDATARETSPDCREVPVPAGASEALRKAIGDQLSSDGSTLREPPVTEADWRKTIKEVNAEGAAVVLGMLDVVPVQVVEDEIAGVKVHKVTREYMTRSNRLFLYVHGGAYVYGAGNAGLLEAILIAERIGIPVISVDYRMPPAHPFPAALDDVVAVYRALVESQPAGSIILGGTSAGGGLALAAVYRLKDLGVRLPGAIYAGTPWADLSKTGDTMYTNEGLDRFLFSYDRTLAAQARLYAGDHDMTDPLISPVYGDFSNFPPTILTTGTRDLFLSDVARTHRKMRAAAVTADLHVYEGMSHVGYIISPGSPESIDMYKEIATFIDSHLD